MGEVICLQTLQPMREQLTWWDANDANDANDAWYSCLEYRKQNKETMSTRDIRINESKSGSK